MKRLILLSLCVSAAAAIASAEIRAMYRVVMADGHVVLARDLPRTNGTVTTFHASDSGVLTGVPSEDVVKIETSVTPRRFPMIGPAVSEQAEAGVRPLEPGEAIDLGPMGDGGSAQANGRSVAASAGANGAAAYGGNGNGTNGGGGYGTTDPRMLGGGVPAAGLLPNGQPSNQPLAGDILRAQSGNVPTMSLDTQTQTSSNGFPATASSQTALVNANGTPNIGPNGFPGTSQTATGPNGFPATTAQSPIGPNGFPLTPQTTTDGNGFPATATQGTTGANGFPAATAFGASKTTVGTNGFPSATATAIGTGSVIVAPNGTVTNVAPGAPPNGNGAFAKSQAGAAQSKSAPSGAAPSPHR